MSKTKLFGAAHFCTPASQATSDWVLLRFYDNIDVLFMCSFLPLIWLSSVPSSTQSRCCITHIFLLGDSGLLERNYQSQNMAGKVLFFFPEKGPYLLIGVDTGTAKSIALSGVFRVAGESQSIPTWSGCTKWTKGRNYSYILHNEGLSMNNQNEMK